MRTWVGRYWHPLAFSVLHSFCPLLHLVVVVLELEAADVGAEDVGLAGDGAGVLRLQPPGLAPHEVEDAAIVGIALAEVGDQRGVAFGQRRPAAAGGRSWRSVSSSTSPCDDADEEGAPLVTARCSPSPRGRPSRSRGSSASAPPARCAARSCAASMAFLLVDGLAERAPHDRGDEAQDGEGQHHLEQREARRSRRRLPPRPSRPCRRSSCRAASAPGALLGAARRGRLARRRRRRPRRRPPGGAAPGRSLAGSVRYCDHLERSDSRAPSSSQITRTVTRRTDSCRPIRIGSMKLLMMPAHHPGHHRHRVLGRPGPLVVWRPLLGLLRPVGGQLDPLDRASPSGTAGSPRSLKCRRRSGRCR